MNITDPEFIHVITQHYPGAVQAQNFWAARPVDPDTRELGDIGLLAWELDADPPLPEQIELWVQELRDDGGLPEPKVTTVTRRQARLALLDAGKLAMVEAAIEAIEDPVEKSAAQIEYEADTWERENAFLQAMWAQLGGTESELDDLFALAATK